MRVVLFLVALLIAVSSADALYTKSDDVVVLTPGNFQKMVKSDEIWMVEFYAPWCGHCKSLAPEWKKAASALKGVVRVAALDMDAHPSVGQPYNVKGFPTIKLFGADKANPEAYSGQRTAPGIVDFALSAAKKVVKARMSGKKSGSSKSKSSKSKSGSKSKSSGNAVVDLTEDDFKEQVLNDKSIWMVEFFAPWCGHCKKLAPEWKDAANKLKGKVKLGAVDCTVHKGVCSKYGVRGYPTIKVFGANKKKPTKYEQARTSGAIVSHALSLYADSAVAPDVHELVDQKVFDEECASSGLCVVAFLPHILDSGAVGRNGYIKLMEGLAEKFKMDPFTYIWAQGYDHPELESAINVGGAGYPALAVINKKKQRAAKFSGAFTESNISSFLQGIFSGRERTHSITLKGSFITTVAKWDGKDGKVVEEEDWEDDHDEL